jgi:hypothetical protein
VRTAQATARAGDDGDLAVESEFSHEGQRRRLLSEGPNRSPMPR